MIVKWLGHASFLIKALEKTIYIDPYAGDYEEKADIILITHGHGDHCDPEKIAAVRGEDTLIVTSLDCARSMQGNIISMSLGDKRELQGVEIEAVEAYNLKRFRSPGVPFHPKETQIAFIISAENKRVYHAGDTDFIPEMNRLKAKKIDLALIPSGGTYTMDVEEAIEATVAINPKLVIPIHRRDASVEEFKKQVEAKSSVKVLAIAEGDDVDL